MKFGTFDWRWPQWNGRYYPDDLPEDWRLSYYANEFETIVLPEDVWRGREAELEECLADLPSVFAVWLEVRNAAIDDFPVGVESVVGALLRGTDHPSLRSRADLLVATFNDDVPGLARCWTPRGGADRDLAPIGIVTAQSVGTPRQMRTCIEEIARAADGREGYLILEGTPPPIELLADAKAIAQLMGV